jgi:stage V sporulation protein G
MSNEIGTKLDVRVYPIEEPKGATVAFASVNIEEIFAVNNIRVINSEKGLFVAMPQVKDSKGEYRDICFPITADFRKQLNETILDAYAAEKEKGTIEKASTVQQLQESKREAITNPVPAKSPVAKGYEPGL